MGRYRIQGRGRTSGIAWAGRPLRLGRGVQCDENRVEPVVESVQKGSALHQVEQRSLCGGDHLDLPSRAVKPLEQRALLFGRALSNVLKEKRPSSDVGRDHRRPDALWSGTRRYGASADVTSLSARCEPCSKAFAPVSRIKSHSIKSNATRPDGWDLGCIQSSPGIIRITDTSLEACIHAGSGAA